MFRLFALLLLILAAPVVVTAAQDTNNDGFVQVLLPIAIPSTRLVEGAHSSLWAQELWVGNSSTAPFFELQPYGSCAPEPCVPTIQPGGTRAWVSMENNRMEGGALFALLPEQADNIHLSSRLQELSRRAQPNGIDIPIVREDQFLTGTSMFLGIPSHSQVRTRFRVYDPRRIRGSTVKIEVIDDHGNVIGETHLVPGDDPAITHQPLATYPYPGLAVIPDIATLFPQIKSLERYNLRVTPLTAGLEYWAFAAVTDVETQHLLLITPR